MKLITSALPYIHGVPHLGNIVGSVLPADVFARFCRLSGEKTIFICGSDSHGTMFEVAAKEKGTTPKELVYQNHEEVKKIFGELEMSFDHYGITDSPANRDLTIHIFEQLMKNGYLEEKEVEGAFCPNCDMFLADRWVEGKCPHCGGLGRGDQCDDCGRLLDPIDIINPECKNCKGKVEFRKTKHIYFLLPKFEGWLKTWVESSKGWSKLAKNETLGFLKGGLKERAITRDASWGFKVPRDGYEKKIFYVWFDAPIGYLAFTKEFLKTNLEFEKVWKDTTGKVELVQFMGKDNTLFHSTIFPSMLYGCNENWKLADRIISSGWLKAQGIKFSKSRGNGITTPEALKMHPADYWRFALISLYPEHDDTLFTMELFREKINNEFADIIGNFVHRVLSFSYANFEGIPDMEDYENCEIMCEASRIQEDITGSFSDCRFQEALNKIVHYAKVSNAYFNNNEPWKAEEERKKKVCAISGNLVKNLAIILYPIVPKFSEDIFGLMNLDKNKLTWEDSDRYDFSGRINKSSPLIQKIEEKK
ncbi:MAG: methionine--tRNA ligase [Candidatus Aenigmarchaeota archaeon]|nr:methionine--tRNA ligase [Candidatus Aenigmarchaeota archaeon]